MHSEITQLPLSQDTPHEYPSEPPGAVQDASRLSPSAGLAGLTSARRRYVLYAVFCLANLLDGYNLNALFVALPVLKPVFGLDEVDASWVMSAFQLTYASFLLVSGRLSDVYHPKPVFIVGVFALGILSLGAGFVKDKIGLIILRALCGICAALSIPSALSLIVRLFPNPREQSVAIAFFGGIGALGDVFGSIVSSVFVQLANYRWIFFFTTILTVPSALLCIPLIPTERDGAQLAMSPRLSRMEKVKRLDLVGVVTLTVTLVLFIFAVTSSANVGWATSEVLTPLVISVFLLPAFFVWEGGR